MGYYFDDSKSINAFEGTQPLNIISSLANRYMGQNLKHGLFLRAYTNSGIVRTTDYRYIVDFNKIYPESKDKDCVWAFAKLWSDGDSTSGFDINCFGPMIMWLNGEEVYKSDIFKERYSENATRVFVNLKKGWNDFKIQFKKTKAGFGAQFGTWIGKWDVYMLMPTLERDGREGWLYTELVSDSYTPDCYTMGMSEKDFDVKVYPATGWSDEEKAMGQMKRMYGAAAGKYAVARTKAFFNNLGVNTYSFTIDTKTPATVYLNDTEIYSTEGGKSDFTKDIAFGEYDILVKVQGSDDDWGFELTQNDGIELKNAANVHGTQDKWIYIGPFDNSYEFEFDKACDMLHVVGEPKVYWRLDEKDTYVRPYNENTLYGRWNYPLGVTMYGLLHTAMIMGSEDIKNYIRDHVQLCVDACVADKSSLAYYSLIFNLFQILVVV